MDVVWKVVLVIVAAGAVVGDALSPLTRSVLGESLVAEQFWRKRGGRDCRR